MGKNKSDLSASKQNNFYICLVNSFDAVLTFSLKTCIKHN